MAEIFLCGHVLQTAKNLLLFSRPWKIGCLCCVMFCLCCADHGKSAVWVVIFSRPWKICCFCCVMFCRPQKICYLGCVSPCSNHNGWLGAKHQVTYLGCVMFCRPQKICCLGPVIFCRARMIKPPACIVLCSADQERIIKPHALYYVLQIKKE